MSIKDSRSPNNRDNEWEITDDQIEDALERLFAAVKDEKVPEAWLELPNQAGAEPEGTKNASRLQVVPPLQAAASPNAGRIEAGAPAGAGTAEMADAANALGLDASHAEPLQAAAARTDTGPVSPAAKRQRRLKRRWLSGAAAAAIAGVMLFSSWGQDVMASMINTFRVQHFESVSITESDLDGFRQALAEGTGDTRELDLRLYGEIEQSGGGTQRTVGSAEAEKLAGRPLKMLPGADAESIRYMPHQELTFKLHPKEINKLIKLLGGKTAFPNDIDNAPIRITTPDSFSMNARSAKGASSSRQLVQLQAPTINVPDEVDVEQVRQAVLDLPMLPNDLRTKLSAIGDWRHTLPVPSMGGEDVKTLNIGGSDAIVTNSGYSRTVLWLQDDWMYMLSGSQTDYPTEDAIIKEAEGLMNA
ncbi:hypothetical protein GXP70_06070 [Paenibacillus lycopersici]|uniref:DUF4367 domain-containing protein n=1 Tax=Paenibacillus lycopersici TaxID=2704462 RepID=A0A6C0FVR7_9BACL|nr:hypothetical protein [Paenibacillus lycopersici]QHT59561.1 hypothetical protein GXP70_06070 [Paenibacillus lycopersici]